jgi:uncharacterized protein (DUF2132 family)
VTELVSCCGWRELGQRIAIKCFALDLSVASSPTFVRKTP